MTDQTPSGGVGPLHEAARCAVRDAAGLPGLNRDQQHAVAVAVLRVVGTHLHAEIEPLRELDIGNEVADVAWRGAIDGVLAVVDALTEHADAH